MTTDLSNAIEALLRDSFTKAELPTCEQYPELERKISVPAVLIEMDDLVPDDDPGTEELALVARFTAYAVLERTPKADLQAANLALSVALKVAQAGRFGQPVGTAKVVRVARDEFKPDLVNYAVWAVEWTHELRLGESVWDGEGVPVTEIIVGGVSVYPEVQA